MSETPEAPAGGAGGRTARVEALWREFAEPLRRTFRRRVRSEDEADELLQETFVRVQRSIDGLRDEERYAAWIRRIAHNVWVEGLRRRGEVEALEPEGPAVEEESDLARVVAGWIEDVLTELEPLDREVLRRIELEGEDRADVARDLGLSPSALKSRVTRGRAKLRARLLECCAFEFDRRGGLLDYRRRGSGSCDGPAACEPC